MLINHKTYLLPYEHLGRLCFHSNHARNGEGCGSFRVEFVIKGWQVPDRRCSTCNPAWAT
jgi:hypothetical protein